VSVQGRERGLNENEAKKNLEKTHAPWIEPVHKSRGLETMRPGDGIVQCVRYTAIVELEGIVARAS
jgi:hypothetical protein